MTIQSKVPTKEYKENYDRIFGGPYPKKEGTTICNVYMMEKSTPQSVCDCTFDDSRFGKQSITRVPPKDEDDI